MAARIQREPLRQVDAAGSVAGRNSEEPRTMASERNTASITGKLHRNAPSLVKIFSTPPTSIQTLRLPGSRKRLNARRQRHGKRVGGLTNTFYGSVVKLRDGVHADRKLRKTRRYRKFSWWCRAPHVTPRIGMSRPQSGSDWLMAKKAGLRGTLVHRGVFCSLGQELTRGKRTTAFVALDALYRLDRVPSVRHGHASEPFLPQLLCCVRSVNRERSTV